jgi:hypothetical protein
LTWQPKLRRHRISRASGGASFDGRSQAHQKRTYPRMPEARRRELCLCRLICRRLASVPPAALPRISDMWLLRWTALLTHLRAALLPLLLALGHGAGGGCQVLSFRSSEFLCELGSPSHARHGADPHGRQAEGDAAGRSAARPAAVDLRHRPLTHRGRRRAVASLPESGLGAPP